MAVKRLTCHAVADGGRECCGIGIRYATADLWVKVVEWRFGSEVEEPRAVARQQLLTVELHGRRNEGGIQCRINSLVDCKCLRNNRSKRKAESQRGELDHVDGG